MKWQTNFYANLNEKWIRKWWQNGGVAAKKKKEKEQEMPFNKQSCSTPTLTFNSKYAKVYYFIHSLTEKGFFSSLNDEKVDKRKLFKWTIKYGMVD